MWALWLPAIVAALVVLGSAPIVIMALRRLKIVDVASERSSHTGVAIRGVGLAILLGVIFGVSLGAFLLEGLSREIILVIGITAIAAALLGAVEDFRGLPIGVRAGLQTVIAICASLSLVVLTSTFWLWCILALIFIAGYINVANFMDGVDGISGVHGVISGTFYAFLGFLLQLDWLIIVGALIGASYLTFLPWNLRRRGTFLGDSGSYLLGAVIGTTAVATWFSGINPIAALGPTIIYCADAGGTLLRRILRGEQWYQPHRNHVYQKLTDTGFTHVAASTVVGIFTAVVAALTLLLAPQSGWNNGLVYLLIITICVIYWSTPLLLRGASGTIYALTPRRTEI